MQKEIHDMATKAARAIFVCGDERKRPTTRISFVSGEWPDNEKQGGGLCEEALTNVIFSALRYLETGREK